MTRRGTLDEAAICQAVRDGWRREDVARFYHTSYCRVKAVLDAHGMGKNQSRRAQEQPRDPVVYLARAILAAACEDWADGEYRVFWDEVVNGWREQGWMTLRQELLVFFASDLFLHLCVMAKLEPEAVLEANEVPVVIDAIHGGMG